MPPEIHQLEPQRSEDRHPGVSLAPGTEMSGAVELAPVRTVGERDQFIAFQLEVYAGDRNYVPPILAERRDFLDPRKNTFLHHAQLEMFLARRGGRIVGRIAAINDPNYNQFHDAEVGFFGLFESINDASVAAGLFDAAAGWIRNRGLKKMIGPVNISMNHDCGLLIEGFEHPPVMMMPYNPRYYPELFDANGLKKHKDLWSYEISTDIVPPEKVVRIAQKLRERDGVQVRSIDVRDIPGEVRRLKSLYDGMLDRTFGFVPLTDEEFHEAVLRLKPLVRIRPELCLVAEIRGEPVAFTLTVPDANVAIKEANGRLTQWGLPIGLFKLAWTATKIDRLRVLFLAIKTGYRRRGLDAVLYLETLKAARRFGFTRGELGWTAENDTVINRAVESYGARRYKTYRIYERTL